MLLAVLEIDENVGALTRSRSFDDAVSLLELHWQVYLSEHPEELRGRILALPDELWGSNAALLLALACSLRSTTSVNAFAALPYLDAADAILEKDASQRPELRVLALLARSAADRGLGQLSDAYARATAAQQILSTIVVSLPLRIELQCFTLLELGICLTLMSDFEGAGLHLRHGLALWDQRPPRTIVVEALGCLAIVEYFSSGPNSPITHIAAARATTEGTSLLTRACGSPVLLAECLLAVDECDLDTAERLLNELQVMAAGTQYELLYLHVAAVVGGARNGPLQQLEELQEIQIVLREWQSPSLMHFLHDSERISALTQLGAISAARDAIAAMPDLTTDVHHALCPARLTARLELHTGEYEAVLATTAGCRALGDNHAPRSLAYVDALRASAHDALGDASTATIAIDRAVFTASRTGWRRHFMTLPHDRLRGIIALARTRRQPDEAQAVLESLSSSLMPDTADSIPPLSTRERLILSHIVAGETRRQISSQLRVSPNTIKTQIRSIYRKLGAANRHEAIDRASKYGIKV